MPQVDLVRERSKKPVIAVGVASVVVVVLIVGGVLALKMMHSTPPLTTQAALDDANGKMFSNNYDGAITTLKAQLKQAKTDDDKVAIYVALAAAYESKGDNATALDNNLKAAKIKSGYGVNEAVARTAEAAGKKDVALDYLQRNRELIKSGKSNQNAGMLPDVEAAITRLGGKL